MERRQVGRAAEFLLPQQSLGRWRLSAGGATRMLLLKTASATDGCMPLSGTAAPACTLVQRGDSLYPRLFLLFPLCKRRFTISCPMTVPKMQVSWFSCCCLGSWHCWQDSRWSPLITTSSNPMELSVMAGETGQQMVHSGFSSSFQSRLEHPLWGHGLDRRLMLPVLQGISLVTPQPQKNAQYWGWGDGSVE